MRKTIFYATVGSRLYGFAMPKSDRDYKGVWMPTPDEILRGSKDHKETETFDNGQTGAKHEESVLYSPRRYIELCSGGNPTVLELAFIPANLVQWCDEFGDRVMAFVRSALISKRAGVAYMGYAHQQLDVVKRSANENLALEVRAGAARLDLVRDFGFDTKAAVHLIRIATQGAQLMRTGVLDPVLHNPLVDELWRIRRGRSGYETATLMIEDALADLSQAVDESTLPERVDGAAVDSFIVELHRDIVTKG